MMLVVMTNKTAIKTRLLRSSLLWLWLHRKNAKIRVIVKIELPSRRNIPAVNSNLSLNICFVLLRVKSTYSLTVACIGLGGGHWIQWCRSLLNIGGNTFAILPQNWDISPPSPPGFGTTDWIFTPCPPAYFFIVTTLSKKQQLCFAVNSAVARATEGWGGTSRKWGGTKINWTFAHKNWYFTATDFNNFAFMAEKQTYKAGSVS